MIEKTNSYKSIYVFLISIVGYRLLLDYIYSNIISKTVSYEGYIFEPSSAMCFVSWIILLVSIILICPIVKHGTRKISEFVIFTLYVISYIPFTTMVYGGVFNISFVVANSLYWYLIIISERFFASRKRRIKLKIGSGDIIISSKVISFIGLLMVALVLYISFVYTHFRINFNLFSVYEIRNQGYLNNLPTLIQYAFEWAKAVSPIFLAYCIYKKNIPQAALYFVTLLFGAGIDGTKTTLFMPFFTALCVIFYNKIPKNREADYVSIGSVTLCLLALIENSIFKTNAIAYIGIRRMLFTPNMISSYYYDYFTHNTPDYFRASFLRHLGLVSPYTTGGKQLGEFIADRYYYRSGVNFNNGLISDAITNMGMLGIILMPIVLVLVLKLFDDCSNNINRNIVFSLAVYLVSSLIGSFITTMLLSHGLLVVLIVLSLFNKSSEFSNKDINTT